MGFQPMLVALEVRKNDLSQNSKSLAWAGSPRHMMKSAVTISLVPESRGGPFVFWDDLPAAARKASALGFDAIEIFPPAPEAIDPTELRALLSETNLKLAAVGTGAGWVKHKLHLSLPDAASRHRARDFIRRHTDFAPIAAALRDIAYTGYLCAEAFPWPNPDQAAQLTIEAFRRHFA